MFFIAAEAAECGRDGREFLVGEVRALDRIVMPQLASAMLVSRLARIV